jgi:lysine 2,3-aminomutase
MEIKTGTVCQYLTHIEQLEQLSDQEKRELNRVTEQFTFRANDYYLSLIDWNDPEDPIRRIIIPHVGELDQWGRLDPSNEENYTIVPGLEHKYNSTVLLLVSNVCGGICRYCFRKRVFINSQSDYLRDISATMQYIKQHKEVTNVLLTGGDPFVLVTTKLENIVRQLREIDHVQIIRIGTKIPAFDPYRIINDPSILEMIEAYSTERKKIYIMTHFIHPRELTDVAVRAAHLLKKAGAVLANQAPLIRGVNDDPDVMADLLRQLSFVGVVPYYIFQCRPALGNKTYVVPIEEGYEIIEKAKSQVSGLAKRARYTMSHSTGKIEVVGGTEEFIHFKYHRAANDADNGRFLIFRRNPDACWLDDYDELVQESHITSYQSYGPD